MKKVLGLILELNPFHNGHKYFIEQAKKEVNPDITIAIITSSFSMRGEVSLIDKFTKADLCMQEGIDLVLELPFLYANNSADYFAYSAISILNEAGITDLAFGTCIDSIDKLQRIYQYTLSDSYNCLLKSFLDKGNSYPNSALKAFMEVCDDKELINNFTLPNNTLAISYLKAIDSVNKSIIPHSIKRIDNMYYDKSLSNTSYTSATSLREALKKKEDISKYIFYSYDFVDEKETNNNLYQLLKYNLITKDVKAYENIASVNEGIENRLININDCKSYDSFLENAATKRYPLNRLKRLVLNILLDTNKKYENMNSYLPYLRILRTNDLGLKQIKNKKCITNVSKAFKEIDDDLKEILDFELKVTKLYDLITNKNTYKEEFIFGVKK